MNSDTIFTRAKLLASVKSMRLRTLPLSLSGGILGILLAVADYRVNVWTAFFIILTCISLQILSNLSNELGDHLSGTDGNGRQGPDYGMQSGGLTVGNMKMLIGFAAICCIVFGLLMIRASFGTVFCLEGIMLMLLGAAAMMAAIRYTLGRNPYGYRGLGDLYVFIFFGIVSVCGSYWVSAHTLNWLVLLPAAAIGFFSVGVLNVNNIRDMESDKLTRTTVAVKLGENRAKIYQTVLVVLGWVCLVAFNLLRIWDPWHWLFLITLPLYIKHLHGIWKLHGGALDPCLPLLVISTFILSLLLGLGHVIYLM